LLYWLKRVLPHHLLEVLRPPYHLALAWIGAMWYRHPSRDITVIAVTGTKGKSTVVELISAILEGAGYTTASLSTIQFKVGSDIRPNLYKMTTPGRFFVQHFLRQAVDARCSHAVIEMTSEGAKQFRHKFIELDALVFTNLAPEHIESHGSFEKYKAAKLKIAEQLERSTKRPRYIVANVDDEHGADFLKINVEEKLPYTLSDLKLHTLHKDGIGLIFQSQSEETTIRVPLVGLFNVYNTLAAITITKALGVSLATIERALRGLPPVRGRVEHFYSPKDSTRNVTAIVDYAHTPDSLEKLYQAFKDVPKVCVLGNTGGGRDTWKRPEMAAIAERYCDHIILTNEDPYDEDPRQIIADMEKGITDTSKLEVIMDRREAIKTAIDKAVDGGYVIISGKGTDPYIMGPHGSKQPWSDAEVVTQELATIQLQSQGTQ
ncbi:UDP-N-acetylmuramoyl-L-alanyl-D-glutamate--2,6-diaminopimelate ligase, partial [Candidatus Kaiserbacteria bacterium]|nr:UDP-N-acetylmuramoyl-L-alanyl-D-glutamate--2,6-diaminopimelate ligase [Candidatus Kaiserbacteria bacterium]